MVDLVLPPEPSSIYICWEDKQDASPGEPNVLHTTFHTMDMQNVHSEPQRKINFVRLQSVSRSKGDEDNHDNHLTSLIKCRRLQ